MKVTKKKCIVQKNRDDFENVLLDIDQPALSGCNSYILVERTELVVNGELLVGKWREVGKRKIIGKIVYTHDICDFISPYARLLLLKKGVDKTIMLKDRTFYPYSNDIEVVES